MPSLTAKSSSEPPQFKKMNKFDAMELVRYVVYTMRKTIIKERILSIMDCSQRGFPWPQRKKEERISLFADGSL